MKKFENAVESKLSELGYDAAKDSTTSMYEKLYTTIHFAMDTTLPTRRRSTGVNRNVSERTKDLFKRRTALRKSGTNEQFAHIQKEIKESSLADYTSWVQEWAAAIGDAERVGGIYNGVKAFARKRAKPPTNLNTDGDGNILKCVKEVVATWYKFLKVKFAATDTECNRPQMEKLP